ncbi:MAG: BCD family MFS transporter [Anaerolineae bacterium]|nr:BCD family MFS transporter [Anaerolineae bacterium]MDW8299002.1 BCD family MFS transporter [Anaerolineae bacterium]
MQAELNSRTVPLGMAVPQERAASGWRNLSVLRNIKIGTFHIGSSLADILASGVWNRIMIKELGFAATPIALLLALRYFLAPLSVWIGRRSDLTNWRGYRRLPYVWGGRLVMALSYVLLGVATLELAGSYNPWTRDFSFDLMNVTVTTNAGSFLGWLGVVTALVLFSVGSTVSSTTFLSLVHDRTPAHQRTRAISVIWFFLILGFAVAGVLYSRLLPEYTRDGFLALMLIAPAIMMGIWIFSLFGEEMPVKRRAERSAEKPEPFWQTMKQVWASRQTRLFFLFLALTNGLFYTQDVILEPFAGTVFGMPLSTTNRFSAYWGSMTLLSIVLSLIALRRFPNRVNNMNLSRWGVILLIATFVMFALSAMLYIRPLVTVALVTMGFGLGMWTVGTLGLMMAMTRAWGAGLYLALWTVASTLARGSGVALGGVLFDIALVILGGNKAFAYGSVFLLQSIGFLLTLFILARISLAEFEREAPQREVVFADSMA